MPRKHRARFVALSRLLEERHPEDSQPAVLIQEGRVLVDGRVITNPRAQVRDDAAIRVVPVRQLRGEQKLTRALSAFEIDVAGMVALDVGAAAGGFTGALLRAGAERVYAVDAGFGQLVGRLRADLRVVNLERTNVAQINRTMVPDPIDLVTMDLSYLPVAVAVSHLHQVELADEAVLLALVKPTFELARAELVVDADAVHAAVERAAGGLALHRWHVLAVTLPMVTGGRGAVEAFVLARRGPD